MTRPGIKRRELLRGGTLVLLLGAQQIARGATIVAVRVWPAPEYSRVTIESDGQLSSKQIVMTNPPRLAVDIEGLDLSPELKELVAKVKPDDPFISGIRVGQQSPGKVRLVVDLKQTAIPQVFTLPPVAAYQHRLVFDFYPLKTVDPLEALIAERMKDRPLPAPTPATDPLGELIAQQLDRPRPAAPATPPAPGRSGQDAGAAEDRPAHHRRARPGPRRRRPRRRRPRGHAREGRGAAGRAPPARSHQRRGDQRQPDAGLPHARRRLLRPAPPARAEGAARAGRPVREHPRRCLPHAGRARRERVRAEPERRVQQRRALDGRPRKPGRPDRRREREDAGRARGAGHAGHEHHRADQRQPQAGQRAAGRDRPRGPAAQGAGGTGGLRGAQGAGHSRACWWRRRSSATPTRKRACAATSTRSSWPTPSCAASTAISRRTRRSRAAAPSEREFRPGRSAS